MHRRLRSLLLSQAGTIGLACLFAVMTLFAVPTLADKGPCEADGTTCHDHREYCGVVGEDCHDCPPATRYLCKNTNTEPCDENLVSACPEGTEADCVVDPHDPNKRICGAWHAGYDCDYMFDCTGGAPLD